MIPALHDADHVIANAIDQTMFIVNAAAPESLQLVSQGFGFAQALVAVAICVLNELIYPAQHLFVRLLPIQIVLPRQIGEDLIHLHHRRYAGYVSAWCRF